MNICYTCFDETSVVSMATLLQQEAAHGHPMMAFYVFVDEGGEPHFKKMQDLASTYGANIVQLDAQEFLSFCSKNEFPTWNGHFLCYARLFLPEMCPELDRIIYLDGDTFVAKPIDGLWNADLHGKGVGAVHDPGFYAYAKGDYWRENGRASINDGVLILDLKRLREVHFPQAVRSLKKKTLEPEKDQGVFNILFSQEVVYLPPAFNALAPIRLVSYRQYSSLFHPFENYDPKSLKEAQRKPVIVHFNRDYFDRPWYRFNRSHYSAKWRSCYKKVYGRSFRAKPIPPSGFFFSLSRFFWLVVSKLLPKSWFFALKH